MPQATMALTSPLNLWALSAADTASVLNVSMSTLYRRRRNDGVVKVRKPRERKTAEGDDEHLKTMTTLVPSISVKEAVQIMKEYTGTDIFTPSLISKRWKEMGFTRKSFTFLHATEMGTGAGPSGSTAPPTRSVLRSVAFWF